MIDFEEDAKNLKLFMEAAQEIAAAARQFNLWLATQGQQGWVYEPLREIVRIERDDDDGLMTIHYKNREKAFLTKVAQAKIKLVSIEEVLGL